MSSNKTRRDFLKMAAVAGAATMGFPMINKSRAAASSKPRNILLIASDEERQRMDFPSDVYFPNRERMAERGTSFSRCHCTTAPCTPARAALYTGLHAPSTGMNENMNFGYVHDLQSDIPTIGHMLREVGYYTAYKGKWHMSDMARIGTCDELEKYGFSDYNAFGDPQGAPRAGQYIDGRIASDAVDWIRNKAPSINGSQPFFLAVNFVNPHDIMFYDTDGLLGLTQMPRGKVPMLGTPLNPLFHQDWAPELPESFCTDNLSTKPAAQREYNEIIKFAFGEIPMGEEGLWKKYINHYINCQMDLDSKIGMVLDALEDAGLADDTIVIFTADHGEMAGAHGGLRQKGPFVYKENVNVPLIIIHPDYAGGAVTEALTSAVDMVPTILSFAGLSEADQNALFPQLVGYDFSGILSNPGGSGPRDSMIFTYDAVTSVDYDFAVAKTRAEKLLPFDPCPNPVFVRPDMSKRGFMRGVYDGRYKFARYFSPVNFNRPENIDQLVSNNDLELYDTWNDPNEVSNLAQDLMGYASLINTMSNKLENMIDAEIGEDVGYKLPDFERCLPPPLEGFMG